MTTSYMIYYAFFIMAAYPLGDALAERPKDWRLYVSLVSMIASAIVAIFMEV